MWSPCIKLPAHERPVSLDTMPAGDSLLRVPTLAGSSLGGNPLEARWPGHAHCQPRPLQGHHLGQENQSGGPVDFSCLELQYGRTGRVGIQVQGFVSSPALVRALSPLPPAPCEHTPVFPVPGGKTGRAREPDPPRTALSCLTDPRPLLTRSRGLPQGQGSPRPGLGPAHGRVPSTRGVASAHDAC